MTKSDLPYKINFSLWFQYLWCHMTHIRYTKCKKKSRGQNIDPSQSYGQMNIRKVAWFFFYKNSSSPEITSRSKIERFTFYELHSCEQYGLKKKKNCFSCVRVFFIFLILIWTPLVGVEPKSLYAAKTHSSPSSRSFFFFFCNKKEKKNEKTLALLNKKFIRLRNPATLRVKFQFPFSFGHRIKI